MESALKGIHKILRNDLSIRDPKAFRLLLPFYSLRDDENPSLPTMTVLIGGRWRRSINVIIQRVRHWTINRVRRSGNPTIR